MNFRRIACALALAAASAAQAAPVTFQFTGVLDSSDVSSYAAGTTVSGQFTYDTDTAPAMDAQSLGDGFSLITYLSIAPDSMLLNIGEDAYTFTNLNVAIVDSTGGAEGGEALSLLGDGASVNGVAGSMAGLSLAFVSMGTNPDVLTLALPSSLNLADFDAPVISPVGTLFTDMSNNGPTASFTVTSLTQATPVPEPGSAWTMLLGLGLVGGLLRARRPAVR